MSAPIPCRWDGEVLRPHGRFQKQAERQFVAGQVYPIAVEQPRSRETHNHYFAAIEEAWRNLPEGIAEQFPTSEHLRKFCLIKAGHANARSVVCSNQVEAHRIAIFVKPIDPYAVVTCSGNVVTLYTAKSQSLKAMDRKTFQESKSAVLEILSDMIGVKTDDLQKNAGQAA
jgi:hypothetical protein